MCCCIGLGGTPHPAVWDFVPEIDLNLKVACFTNRFGNALIHILSGHNSMHARERRGEREEEKGEGRRERVADGAKPFNLVPV